jgi:hypothetical protein
VAKTNDGDLVGREALYDVIDGDIRGTTDKDTEVALQ